MLCTTDTNHHTYVYRIFWNPLVLLQKEWETSHFHAAFILYLFKNVSRCHLFSQPNYAPKRYVNEVAKRVYCVIQCVCVYILFVLLVFCSFLFLFSFSFFFLRFSVLCSFFLTMIQWEMQTIFYCTSYLLGSPAKIHLLSCKFQKNKTDRCNSFNAWWPIFRITSALEQW